MGKSLIKEYIVELKTKEGFIFYYIPKIKVKADDKTEAGYKALDVADKKLNFKKIALEVFNVKEIVQ